MSRRAATLVAALAAALAAGCGGELPSGTDTAGQGQTGSAPPSRVDAIEEIGGDGFNPAEIYRREAPGVVTVISEFGQGPLPEGPQEGGGGLGSGFVISADGEIATNAHVVTNGQGAGLRPARAVYVQFADGNQVSARIVGTDPNADVALLRVDPAGLALRPLPLGSSAKLTVGAPVAAIGSPFGEPQSLSVGVLSAVDRTIRSLTDFQISDAIQTDAAVNRGNSGGPLVDARGRVLGINSQIESTGGGGEGVGFAVPVDQVKRSLDQLRQKGRVSYAYIGVSSAPLYPQLSRRLGIPVQRGAFVQEVQRGSPAARAGLRGGNRTLTFQGRPYRVGGDAITRLNGTPLREESDLSRAVNAREPGDTVTLEVYRGDQRRTVRVILSERPTTIQRPRP